LRAFAKELPYREIAQELTDRKLARQLRQLGDVHRVPLRFIAISMI